MEFLYWIILFAALVQLAIYYFNRQKKKEDSVLDKYNIKSRGDLFKIINSHNLPEEDRILLEKHYQQNS